MKHKTSELTGPLLDAAVAMALGLPRVSIMDVSSLGHRENGRCYAAQPIFDGTKMAILPFEPSSSWSSGGPIMGKYDIAWFRDGGGVCYACVRGVPDIEGGLTGLGPEYGNGSGPDPLTAAMRAFVASKLGHEAELP